MKVKAKVELRVLMNQTSVLDLVLPHDSIEIVTLLLLLFNPNLGFLPNPSTRYISTSELRNYGTVSRLTSKFPKTA
jgi:hypothetical protein